MCVQVPTLVLWAEHDAFAGTDIIGGIHEVRHPITHPHDALIPHLVPIPPPPEQMKTHHLTPLRCCCVLPLCVQRVSDLQVRIIDNASHWVQNDCPDVVNGAIASFLHSKAAHFEPLSMPKVSAAGLRWDNVVYPVPILSRSGSCRQMHRRLPRAESLVLVQQ